MSDPLPSTAFIKSILGVDPPKEDKTDAILQELVNHTLDAAADVVDRWPLSIPAGLHHERIAAAIRDLKQKIS